MAAEHDVRELLPSQNVQDIGDMGFKSYVPGGQMAALSIARKGGGKTSWPRAVNNGLTRFQSQPPCQAPWMSTNVAMLDLPSLLVDR